MESFRFKQNFLMVVFIFSISVSANETLTVVNGEVSDIDTGETLPFAKVELKQTNQVIVANQNGRFTLIDVPIGSILVISKTGYEGTEIIISSEIQKLAIGLSKYNSDNFMEEVMVTAKTPQKIEDSGISQYSLSPELTNSLPNLGEQDIFRSMQLLPGVSGSNESSSGLIVRGGTIDQNLVLFDDFTVYHVDHVFGFFSAFNNNAIKDVQFYKGGFSAKYGGRMSSVVDITGKDGNTEQFNIGGGVSLLSANAVIETPFADGAGSFIFTGRQSYQSDLYDDILESVTGQNQNAQSGTSTPGQFALGRFAIEPKSYFYDLNAKLTYRLPNDDKFSISFYNGADELDNSRKIDGNANLDRLCELLDGNGPFGGAYCEEEISFAVDTIDLSEWGNTGASFKYSHQSSERFDTTFILSASEYFSNRERQIDSQVVYEDSNNDPAIGQSNSSEENKLNDLTVKLENDFYLNQENTLSFGFQYTQQDIDFYLTQNDALILETKNEASTSTIYLEDEVILGGLKIIPGIRISHFDINDEVYTEPRLSIAYDLNEETQLRAAFGDYHQFALSISRQSISEGPRNFWTLADDLTIPVSKSRHLILGATHNIDDLNFSIELFHKDYEGLSEFRQQNNAIQNEDGTGLTLVLEEDFNSGSGIASGVELFLQKNIGSLTGWAGYTFSEVVYDFPSISDVDYFADQDTTHEFKTVLMYQWNNWDFASTFIYATGRPYTEVLGVKENIFPPSYEVGNKNDNRYDDYHRLDLSATYNFLLLGTPGKVGLSLFNVYDRKNEWYTEYDIIEGEILETEINYRGFTPSVFINWNLY